tara:strand:- start:112 stop:672 length:561 start_codon:yes stop_codon:yes gene_type:complete
MKITLAGSLGSGKSTLRNMLAEHYGLKLKGTGDFMRELSKKYGYSDITKFISEYVSEHPEIDLQVDEEQRNYGKENDDFVLDAHLGFHFVPDSIRICLRCDTAESARRILEDNKRTTEDAKTVSESIESSVKRREVMRKNYQNLYKVDIDDLNNFDFVLDTTSLSYEEVFEKVISFIERSNSKNEV